MRKLAFAILIVAVSALASGCHVGVGGGHHRHHCSIDRAGSVPAVADGAEVRGDQGPS